MQQLTALDLMFSSLDSETTNGVLGGLVLHEPPTDGRAHADAAFMRARLAQRLPYLPPLHRRLVKVPIGIDHDYLARTGRIDLHQHVRTVSLPAPGTQEQLAAEVSAIMSTSLPPDRPPWDYTVIEGLADGSIAHLLRIHHLVIDGGSMPVLWDLLADEPTAPLPAPAPMHPEPRFGTPELWARELAGTVTKPITWSAFLLNYLRWAAEQTRAAGPLAPLVTPARFMLPGPLAKPVATVLNPVLRKRGIAEIKPYLPALSAPRTSFNNRVSPARSFVFADLPLADFKDAGRVFGGTVNDAVLSVCAGALRRYLTERGEPVDRPLVVCVPVSIREPDETLQWANFVHMIFAELPTHLSDPVARLRFAKEAVRGAKANFDAMPTGLIRQASRFIPSAAFNLPVRLMVKLPDALSKGPWNVVVSNVRGPSTGATMDGLAIKGYWPASFLSIGGGINITLQSYTDRICFGLMSTPEQAPDLHVLTGYMTDALAELVHAAQAQPTPATSARRLAPVITPSARRRSGDVRDGRATR